MVGARFAGLDGVSLESAKLADALARGGHEMVWFAGEVDEGFSPSTVYEAASFETARNAEIQSLAFGGDDSAAVREMVETVTPGIESALGSFLDDNGVEGVIVENAWAIPMQLPLAVAIARVVESRGIATVGHHHDFSWERPRFSRCSVPGLIEQVFPPDLPSVAHMVINSLAKRDLAQRRGLDSLVLPNVMDFESEPPQGDGGVAFRRIAGLDPLDIVLLQPTRVIPRKGIELTIDLASRIDGDPVVVVTHPDDLHADYWAGLVSKATELDVDLRLVDAGRDIASLASAYAAADLVCFPSLYEGYGNAVVEAVYHRRPVLVNRYSVYVSDIAPLGFGFIEVDGVIANETVTEVNRLVAGESAYEGLVDRNFAIGRTALSYAVARDIVERSFAAISSG
jgi:glycosyltransferase involved in cell wall biosynthesis